LIGHPKKVTGHWLHVSSLAGLLRDQLPLFSSIRNRFSTTGELVSRFDVDFIVVKRLLDGFISGVNALQSSKLCIGSAAESLQFPVNLRPALRIRGIFTTEMIASITTLYKGADILRQSGSICLLIRGK